MQVVTYTQPYRKLPLPETLSWPLSLCLLLLFSFLFFLFVIFMTNLLRTLPPLPLSALPLLCIKDKFIWRALHINPNKMPQHEARPILWRRKCLPKSVCECVPVSVCACVCVRVSQVSAAVGALTALRVKSFSSCFSQLNKFPSLLARPTWPAQGATRRRRQATRGVQRASKLTNNAKQSTVARTKNSSNKVSTVFPHWLVHYPLPSPLLRLKPKQIFGQSYFKSPTEAAAVSGVCGVVWRGGGREVGEGHARAGVWLCNENFEKQITCKLSFSIQLSGDRWQSSLHTFAVEARGMWQVAKCH